MITAEFFNLDYRAVQFKKLVTHQNFCHIQFLADRHMKVRSCARKYLLVLFILKGKREKHYFFVVLQNIQ